MNLDIQMKILNTMQSVINRFIWNFKTAKIKACILQQSIQKGALCVPNIVKYCQAAQTSAFAQ